MRSSSRPQRVLIASSHALFGQGLRSLLQSRQKADVEVVGVVSGLNQVLAAIDRLNPDLVIVDYDDEQLNRDEFLARFVEGERKMRVVLLSLQNGEEAIVYDRRTLAASQIEDWLEAWPEGEIPEKTPSERANLNAQHPRRSNMRHLIFAGILVIVVTALLILGLQQVRLLPEQASLQAVTIDQMFDLEFYVIAFLFALIVVFMLYSILVFRRKPGDTSDARHVEGNTRLEVAWTIIPLITVLAFSVKGAAALAETQRVNPDALEVNVIGQQWTWRFEYPGLGIVSNELRLPVNQQALLHLSAVDVIHSFWVPEFRVKQDALPGGEAFVRDLRVTPTLTGEYKVRCAELCGLDHAKMENNVLILSQAEFDAWVSEQTGESADPVERGRRYYEVYGCNACHTLDGTIKVGPSWLGIYGEGNTFTDGSTGVVDDAYLIESIRNPAVKIVAGFPNAMPANVAQNMTDRQIQDIIEFIKSLK